MSNNPSASNKSPDSVSVDLLLNISAAHRNSEDVGTEAPTYAYRCGPGVVILRVYDEQSGKIFTEMWIMRRARRADSGNGDMSSEGAVGIWVAKLRGKMKMWRAG
jgi:hypothetical protein